MEEIDEDIQKLFMFIFSGLFIGLFLWILGSIFQINWILNIAHGVGEITNFILFILFWGMIGCALFSNYKNE